MSPRPSTGEEAPQEPSGPPCVRAALGPSAPLPRALDVPGASVPHRPSASCSNEAHAPHHRAGPVSGRRWGAPLGKPSGERRHRCMGGSVVEFSPATREARVRFPAHAARRPLLASPAATTRARARPRLPLAHAQGPWPKPALLRTQPEPGPALPPVPFLSVSLAQGTKLHPAPDAPGPPTRLPCPFPLQDPEHPASLTRFSSSNASRHHHTPAPRRSRAHGAAPHLPAFPHGSSLPASLYPHSQNPPLFAQPGATDLPPLALIRPILLQGPSQTHWGAAGRPNAWHHILPTPALHSLEGPLGRSSLQTPPLLQR